MLNSCAKFPLAHSTFIKFVSFEASHRRMFVTADIKICSDFYDFHTYWIQLPNSTAHKTLLWNREKKINVEWLPYEFRFYTRKLHMITHCKPRNALGGASGTPTSLVRTSTSVSTAGKSTKLGRIHVAGSSYHVSRNFVYWFKKHYKEGGRQETCDKQQNFKSVLHAGFTNMPSSHGNQQLPPFIPWNQDFQIRKNAYGKIRKCKERVGDKKGYDKNIKLPNRISNSSDFSMQCSGSL
jgi:hypothetical protein